MINEFQVGDFVELIVTGQHLEYNSKRSAVLNVNKFDVHSFATIIDIKYINEVRGFMYQMTTPYYWESRPELKVSTFYKYSGDRIIKRNEIPECYRYELAFTDTSKSDWTYLGAKKQFDEEKVPLLEKIYRELHQTA